MYFNYLKQLINLVIIFNKLNNKYIIYKIFLLKKKRERGF